MASMARLVAARTACMSTCLSRASCCKLRCLAGFSSISHTEKGDKLNASQFELVYTAPIAGAVKAIKVFSLSTCVATIIGLPILVVFGKLSLMGKVSLACVIGPIGIGTTFLLHLFVRGYITNMWYSRKTNKLRISTLSLLATNVMTEFGMEDIDAVDTVNVLSTFTVKGKGYFIHPEVFSDKELVERLLQLQTEPGELL
ncbi:uncharacterized protein LOC134179009 [Corticium candelabrum]|uniref:uncharacterized protein LOC134179009 n=1 Tax=Corticium candelabrum TaxID=121492 RepID=UPI002E26470B|nr:uncharacterized protein LOC134179009 [Corticium candelabrum]